jgi:hypothetical protein
MSTIKLTFIHYISFLYVAYAHQTDGIYCRDEQSSVWKCTKKWAKDILNHGEFSRIMDESMIWYKDLKDSETFHNDVMEIADRLNNFEWFNIEQKLESLKDLKIIALSDKLFLDSEKKWIRNIAHIWNIEPKLLRKVLR